MTALIPFLFNDHRDQPYWILLMAKPEQNFKIHFCVADVSRSRPSVSAEPFCSGPCRAVVLFDPATKSTVVLLGCPVGTKHPKIFITMRSSREREVCACASAMNRYRQTYQNFPLISIDKENSPPAKPAKLEVRTEGCDECVDGEGWGHAYKKLEQIFCQCLSTE